MKKHVHFLLIIFHFSLTGCNPFPGPEEEANAPKFESISGMSLGNLLKIDCYGYMDWMDDVCYVKTISSMENFKRFLTDNNLVLKKGKPCFGLLNPITEIDCWDAEANLKGNVFVMEDLFENNNHHKVDRGIAYVEKQDVVICYFVIGER